MRVPPASISFSNEDISNITEEISECLRTGALTLGQNGRQFEEEFAALCRVPYAVAVNSGTSALEIILRAIGVQNREVIVPTNTFFATAAAVIHAGGRVRFADCEPGSFALDLGSLRECLNANTAAIIVVHIGGLITPRISEISDVCKQVGVPLIEDAAHAQGSTLGGRPAGSFGVAAAFSFYPTKVMTSCEGGMITTSDEAIYHEALIYRDQGKEGFTTNYHVRLGYNWRMSEPHAIIGRAQLRHGGRGVDPRIHEGVCQHQLPPRPRSHQLLQTRRRVAEHPFRLRRRQHVGILDGAVHHGADGHLLSLLTEPGGALTHAR